MESPLRVANFNYVKLSAIAAVTPRDVICLKDELIAKGDSAESAARISEVSGFETRRVAPDGVTASDLCAQAAKKILANADPSQIDCLVFLSESPDYPTPATASILQDELGLSRNCAAFDMTAACAGYIHALWTGAGLIESGACRSVLICAGNATARFYNPDNRVIAPIFGDAGTATLLERSPIKSPMSFGLGNDGSKAEYFICPSGGARIPPRAEDGADSGYNAVIHDPNGNPWTLGGYAQCWMNGMELFRAVVSTVPSHIKSHLKSANENASDLDGVVLHQGNKLMVETIAKKIGAKPNQTPWQTLRKYGNQMCASLPVVVCDQYCEAINVGNPLKLLLCGYGAGFSWGSCLLTVKDAACYGVSEYRPDAPMMRREELISRWHEIFKGKPE